jgi:uncharacterized repeat protein (TIGR04044 family)
MAILSATKPKTGDSLVNLDEKLYPDHKADAGQRALIMMHTVPYEGSVGLVNMLTTTRIARKGFKTTLALYGPGVLMASAGRGFPTVGTEGFPGNLAINRQLETIMKEGSTIHACRFAMVALYGMRETDLMEGVAPYHPLDVLDCLLDNWKSGALIISTWTV